MSLSLYDISVPNYLQMLGSTIGVLSKSAEHAEKNGLDLDTLLAAKLHLSLIHISEPTRPY